MFNKLSKLERLGWAGRGGKGEWPKIRPAHILQKQQNVCKPEFGRLNTLSKLSKLRKLRK